MRNETPRPDDLEIALRIPGRWRAPEDLVQALPRGCAVGRTPRGERLRLPDGASVALHALPADGEFPFVFRTACRDRLPHAVRRSIDRAPLIACVTGSGGSLTAVTTLLAAGAALLRAGGAGVFVDSGLVAHAGPRWLSMADESSLDAAFEAFVGLVRTKEEIWSLGMHALGLADAAIGRRGNDALDERVLLDFLAYTCGPLEGHDRDGSFERVYPALRIEPDAARFEAGSPAHNPYGQWRLTWTTPVAPS
jgi:hypothetical protein